MFFKLCTNNIYARHSDILIITFSNGDLQYYADREFLFKLIDEASKKAGINFVRLKADIYERKHLNILADFIPDEVRALAKINNDLVEAFKAYYNDKQLDRLAKDNE